MANHEWTAEEEDRIKALHAKGYSASQVAAAISVMIKAPVTRNQIIGKLARMADVPGRPERIPGKPRSKIEKPSKPAIVIAALKLQKARKAPPPKPRLLLKPEPTGKIGVMELTSTTCRWPMGDPQSKDFHFCGCELDAPFSEVNSNSAYCAYHAKEAYTGYSFGHDPTAPRLPRNQFLGGLQNKWKAA